MGFLIMGAFGTHGFQFCNKLLEIGYEVLHYNINDEFIEPTIFENKQLMIGRNSNFKKIDVSEPIVNKDIAIILPLVDWDDFQKSEIELSRKRSMNFLKDIGNSTRENVWIFILNNKSTNELLDFKDEEIKHMQTVFLKSELTEIEKIIEHLDQIEALSSQAIRD